MRLPSVGSLVDVGTGGPCYVALAQGEHFIGLNLDGEHLESGMYHVSAINGTAWPEHYKPSKALREAIADNPRISLPCLT